MNLPAGLSLAAVGYGLAAVALGVVMLLLLLWGWRRLRAVRDAAQQAQQWLRDERRAWEVVLRETRGALERCSAVMETAARAGRPAETVTSAGAAGWAAGAERVAGRDLNGGRDLGAGQNLNVSVRSQVLRRSRRGESAAQIAAGLAVPRDEVALLLKIHNLAGAEAKVGS